VVTATKKYQTKPLESFKKAVELRKEYYQQVMLAKEQGKLLITGGADSMVALPAGLGDFVFFEGEPYGATISMDPQFSEECVEAAEAKNFARDMCAYMRNYWGSMYLNKYYFGGEFPKPDFVLQLGFCDTHAKWMQQVSEYLSAPYFAIDMPVGQPGRNEEAKTNYLASQMNDAIEWMAKVTGRKYDDDKLREAVRNECKSSALWSEIVCYNKAIPAPLEQRTIFTLYIICILRRHEKESVEFYEMLRDEVKQRVADGIAAVATERCRLMDDSQPPWYFLQLYKYLEKYGAAVVGSHYSFFLGGSLDEMPDGTLGPPKTPDEQGLPMKTREDVLKAYAQWYIKKPIISQMFALPYMKSEQMLQLVKEWKVNGVIFHLNRGCEGTAMGQMENRLALTKAKIPVMTYEGNMADRREFDEGQTLKRIDAFMESLGLEKLED
jgi:benzoyl-CoA reductase subunit B